MRTPWPASRFRLSSAGLGIFLFHVLAFLVLTAGRSRYFLQDDNWAQFGPVMMGAARAFFHEFTLALWNPWTSLGAPVLEIGTYALLYPPTYLSYAVAAGLLGDATYMIDVFCWFHLVAGSWIAYRFFKSVIGDRAWSVFASLSFVYSGFFLIGGRSWYYMTPLALWLPAIFYYSLRDPRTLSLRQWALWVVAIALFYLSGNAQMWTLACVFLGVVLLYAWLVEHRIPWREVLLGHSLPMFARILLLIGVPLWLQYTFAVPVERKIEFTGFFRGLWNFFLPGFLRAAPHPTGWGNVTYMGSFYFAGGIFFTLALLGVGKTLWQFGKRERPRSYGLHVLLALLFVVSFLWGLGDRSFVARWIAHVPPFHLFSWPFKLIIFVHFFAIILAGLSFAAWFRSSTRFKRYLLPIGYGLVIGNILYSQTAFYEYEEETYQLDSELVRGLDRGKRYVNVAPNRMDYAHYSRLLPHNIPVLARQLSFHGYEPFVLMNPRTVLYQVAHSRRKARDSHALYGVSGVIDYRAGKNIVEPLADRPLAFCEKSGEALVVRWDWNELIVEGSQKCGAEPVVLTWTFWSFFQSENYRVGHDQYARIRLTARKGEPPGDRVSVRYRIPWLKPWAIFVAFFLLSEGLRRTLGRSSRAETGRGTRP